MDGEDGKQQAHLVLAHKLFLLTQPDVDDIEKVGLRDEVLAAFVADGIIFTIVCSDLLICTCFEFRVFEIAIFGCRYGPIVRNPSLEFRAEIRSEDSRFDAC